MSQMSAKDDAELAKERDQKFKNWLQNKALKDKAFELLGKLNSSRASDDDQLLEVGVALCAVDRILGVDEIKSAPKDQHPNGPGDNTPRGAEKAKTEPSPANKKTLKHAWMKWTMEYHSFSMLILGENDMANISEAVKEFMFSEAELALNGGGEAGNLSKVKNILPSLKYFFPTIPKPGDKAKPLTKDQKYQNIMYMRELKKSWKKCKDELDNRITEYVAKGMKTKHGLDYDPEMDSVQKEQNAKLRYGSSAYSDPSDDYNAQGGNNARNKLVKQLESQCLYELSMKRLKTWVEEDEDKKLAEEAEDNAEKSKLAKTSHEQFVKKKDGLRIRMPNDMVAPTAAPMTYGREMAGLHAQGKSVSTTVELMAGLGLKYVHATNKGRKGVEGDLEKSRNQLLKLGFVEKENFEEEEMDQYYRHKDHNPTNVERQQLEQKMKENNQRAYDEWLQMKDLHDQAVRGVQLLTKPKWKNENLAFFSSSFQRQSVTSLHGGGGGTSGLRRSMSNHGSQVITETQQTLLMNQNPLTASTSSLNSLHPNKAKLQYFFDQVQQQPDIFQHCVEMGKILKRIDRLLFNDWSKWCDEVIPNAIATILWDFFTPIACDVHTVAYSQIRETFFKLLRPGVDYRDLFLDFVYRTILNRRIENVKEKKGYFHAEDEEKQQIEEELESMKKEWLQSISLTKDQLKQLLLQLGITLKGHEMNTLVDAFDSNGDGVITITEFLDFCGPKRDKKAGNSLIVSHQKCCWMSTCKVTGMPCGFRTSNPTKRLLQQKLQSELTSKEQAELAMKKKSEEMRKRMQSDDVYEEELDNKSVDGGGSVNGDFHLTGKVVMKQLTNGEMRMCVELKERVKREEVLKRLGLLMDEGKEKRRKEEEDGKQKKSRHKDEYEDDEYDEYSEDEHQSTHSKGSNKHGSKKGESQGPPPCAYVSWTFKDRTKAMKELNSITKDAREEQVVKNMIANGKPPQAPKLWVDMKPLLQKMHLQQQQAALVGGEDTGDQYLEDEEESEEEMEAIMLGESKSLAGGRMSTSSSKRRRKNKKAIHELILQWCSGVPSELVSFYSIEFGGAVVSSNTVSNGTGAAKLADVKYTEVFRDPPDAQLQNQFIGQFLLKQLLPGTTYRFRIRAVNGFGPGEYTYKTFTTLTTAPNGPVITKLTSDSVTLRWTFTKYFLDRMNELKKLFQVADKDKSNDVSREELVRIFDDKLDEFTELQDFIHKFLKTKGVSVPKSQKEKLEAAKTFSQIATSGIATLVRGSQQPTINNNKRSGSYRNVYDMLRSEEEQGRKQRHHNEDEDDEEEKEEAEKRTRYGVLFDLIESDDDGRLTWIEFEKFFMSLGWTNAADLKGNNEMMNTSQVIPSSSNNKSGSNNNKGNSNKTVKEGDVVFVVERCESEFDDVYKEILRTNVGYATINHLLPGESYRFRIYSLNIDEIRGPSSPSVLVHTLIETPSPPLPKQIFARSLCLTWKGRVTQANSRNQAFVSRMVEDWTHAHNEQDKGVSIEAIFAKYDRNHSGDIDSAELACVLEDLGVAVTEERLAQAFQQLDVNSDGSISFDEFSKWWRREEVVYILKRSEAITTTTTSSSSISSSSSAKKGTGSGGGDDVSVTSTSKRAASTGRGMRRPSTGGTGIGGGIGGAGGGDDTSTAIRSMSRGRRPSTTTPSGGVNTTGTAPVSADGTSTTMIAHVPVPIVVSRDTKTRMEVAGLCPNTLYHFKVRYLGPRSSSILSNPLVIMTAPLPPSPPILIDVTSNTVHVKWYPGEFGAYKFIVQMRAVSTANALAEGMAGETASSSANGRKKSTTVMSDPEGWMTVYNGSETVYTNTTLATETLYELRVLAVNFQGNNSEFSPSLKFLTLPRHETAHQLTSKNMNQTFTIECTGDICVGDTILITERLFLKPSSSSANASALNGGGSQLFTPSVAGSQKAGTKITTTGGGTGMKKGLQSSTTNAPLNQSMDGNITISGGEHTFLGERTIACYVSKDNYRSTRDLYTAAHITAKQSRMIGETRKVWLEVIWQKSTTEACKRYEVKAGDVLERSTGHLEQFEVYRIPWAQEKFRCSLVEEWKLLKDCYWTMDC